MTGKSYKLDEFLQNVDAATFSGKVAERKSYNVSTAFGEKTIRIKYLDGAHKLEKIKQGDWIDLYTYENVIIPPHSSTLLNLGVAMELPAGYEAWIIPRSSTFRKFHLIQTNGVGMIDNLFQGDADVWMMSVFNISDNAVTIPKNTRVCQFRIAESQPSITFEEVETLGNTNRSGFGSTGS